MSNWFHRKEKGIQTPTSDKKDSPDGLWYKSPSGQLIHRRELKKNAYVCPEDNHHVRIGSKEYFDLLFDESNFEELDQELCSSDPLHFVDHKPYAKRLSDTQAKTGLNDAVRTAQGKLSGKNIVIACMDFTFIGGSMGAAVGEKISRATEKARKTRSPLLIICKSGGARMMEAGFSLMQLPKIIAQLVSLSESKIPYLSLLTDPTTGGVTASFGMLGDLNLAEPGALIGFAGPRVIRETIGKDLPKGFQRAEFLQEHGFIDRIIDRRSLKQELSEILDLLSQDPLPSPLQKQRKKTSSAALTDS